MRRKPGVEGGRGELPSRVEAVEKRICGGRRSDLRSQIAAGSASSRHSGPDRLQQRSDTNDRDHPLDVLGQDVEAHFGADPLPQMTPEERARDALELMERARRRIAEARMTIEHNPQTEE